MLGVSPSSSLCWSRGRRRTTLCVAAAGVVVVVAAAAAVVMVTVMARQLAGVGNSALLGSHEAAPTALTFVVVDESDAMMYYTNRDLPTYAHVMHERCSSVRVEFPGLAHTNAASMGSSSSSSSNSGPLSKRIHLCFAMGNAQQQCLTPFHDDATRETSTPLSSPPAAAPLLNVVPAFRHLLWRKDAFCRCEAVRACMRACTRGRGMHTLTQTHSYTRLHTRTRLLLLLLLLSIRLSSCKDDKPMALRPKHKPDGTATHPVLGFRS